MALINRSLILGKEVKLTTQEVVRNTWLRLMFVLVFEQVRHQVDLLDLGKRRRIKFQIKELFINMYCSSWMFSVGSFVLDLVKVKVVKQLSLS